jgi:hypothetical protein
MLRHWHDEAPLRPVLVPIPGRSTPGKHPDRKLLRYAAIAAAILVAFISGFAMRDLTFGRSEYATRVEIRQLMKEAIYDAEARVTETTNIKLQRVLETVENEQGYMYLRLTRSQGEKNRNKN